MMEPKPCPFCGSEALLSTIGATMRDGERTYYTVRCRSVACSANQGYWESPEAALSHWNTRFLERKPEYTPYRGVLFEAMGKILIDFGKNYMDWEFGDFEDEEETGEALDDMVDSTALLIMRLMNNTRHERTCRPVEKDSVMRCPDCDYPLGIMSVPAYCPGCGAKVVGE